MLILFSSFFLIACFNFDVIVACFYFSCNALHLLNSYSELVSILCFRYISYKVDLHNMVNSGG